MVIRQSFPPYGTIWRETLAVKKKVIWRETLAVGKFGKFSAKTYLANFVHSQNKIIRTTYVIRCNLSANVRNEQLERG